MTIIIIETIAAMCYMPTIRQRLREYFAFVKFYIKIAYQGIYDFHLTYEETGLEGIRFSWLL